MAQKGHSRKGRYGTWRSENKNPFFLFQLCVGEFGGGGGGERNFRFCLLLSRSAIAHSQPRPTRTGICGKGGESRLGEGPLFLPGCIERKKKEKRIPLPTFRKLQGREGGR